MKKLNMCQKEAVEWKEGPCLVVAGPGSGKTFVLINRIIKLISTGVIPESILIITFTKAAANEMKERYNKFLLEERIKISSSPTFGTFHSVFYDILRNDFGYTKDSLISDIDTQRIILSIIEQRKDLTISLDTANNIISDILSYKISLEKNEKFSSKYVSKKAFFEIYEKYQEKMFNERKLDFFDMVVKCNELLKNNKDVLKYYSDKYRYFLIDEFQDINKLQYDVVKLICNTNNLFVVGDDDQSIYRFRGSHPSVMKDFLKDYRNAHVVMLNENYRCARIIVKHAKKLIENNNDRFYKDLVAKREDIGTFEIKSFYDSGCETKYIVEKIRYYATLGIKYSEMAILYRTNQLSSTVVKALNEYNIPYVLKTGNNSIYDCFAIKDILSYLKIATGSRNPSDFILIANKPLRYISRNSIGYNETSIDTIMSYYNASSFIYKNLVKFKHDISVIRKTITPLAIRYIRKNIGYDKYLIDYCKKKYIDYEEIMEMLDAFEEDSIGHNDINEYLEYIENDINKCKNVTLDDAISLMTFHLSKGLEYKVVFIADANDMIIPHKKSIRENDIETERRLFYVAMTRAKDYLHIFFTKKRFGKDYKASRFILDAIGERNG